MKWVICDELLFIYLFLFLFSYSLQVDGFYNVSFVPIARSGSYLYQLSPKDAVLREVIVVYCHSDTDMRSFFILNTVLLDLCIS